MGETTTRLRRVRPRGDAAAAGEEVEGELIRRLVEVGGQLLEPRQAGAGGALGGGDDGAALCLVGGQRARGVGLFLEAGGQREGVLDGEFGAGADGEVRGVRGIAEQHRAAVRPARVDDRTERGPGGVVGVQRTAAQRLGEGLGAPRRRLLLIGPVEPGGPPDLFPHLDDDGAGIAREGVGVELYHPVLRFRDLEPEGVEGEVGGEPDVAAAVGGQPRAEGGGVGGAGGAVHPVGGDDQVVGAGEFRGGRGLGAKAQVDAEGAAAPVQDVQQPAAAERGETVATGGQGAAPVDDVDVVPADELRLERAVDLRVGVLDAAEGLVGEDDAETEGVVGGIALPHGDLAGGVEAFEQGGGVEPGGPAADDRDPHGYFPCHLGVRFSVKAAWNSA